MHKCIRKQSECNVMHVLQKDSYRSAHLYELQIKESICHVSKMYCVRSTPHLFLDAKSEAVIWDHCLAWNCWFLMVEDLNSKRNRPMVGTSVKMVHGRTLRIEISKFSPLSSQKGGWGWVESLGPKSHKGTINGGIPYTNSSRNYLVCGQLPIFFWMPSLRLWFETIVSPEIVDSSW